MAVFGAVFLAGCDSLVNVEAPGRLQEEDLEGPDAIPKIVESAVGDFDCALGAYVAITGEVTNEFMGSHIIGAEFFEYDRRDVQPERRAYAAEECGSYGALYQPLSTAVFSTSEAISRLESVSEAEVPNRLQLLAEMKAYGGYARLLLGEGFCTAAVLEGPELSSTELFSRAEEMFSAALQDASGETATSHMARAGRARARLNLEKHVDALADAEEVPDDFLMEAHFSDQSERSRNPVFNQNNRVHNISVAPQSRNLMFEGVDDPRVEVIDTGELGTDLLTAVWTQTKYPSLNASIPIASGDEARLIEAEIKGGQAAVDIINEFHADAGLPEFSATSEDDIRQHVIQERARELFLEGQRFWDVRRFELPFDPAVGTPYQVTAEGVRGIKGGTYGDMRCFPLPELERSNNPNIN